MNKKYITNISKEISNNNEISCMRNHNKTLLVETKNAKNAKKT